LAAGVLPGSDKRDDYVFVPDTDRWVEVFHDKTTSLGHLDAAGNFLPLPEWLNHPRGEARSVIARRPEMLNYQPEKNVYEFRSGRLIKGQIDAKGYFIPEIGSKVIDFKDYHYRPDGPRIWNLPGRFEKRIKTSCTRPQHHRHAANPDFWGSPQMPMPGTPMIRSIPFHSVCIPPVLPARY